jgi:hypothetical protein
MASVGNSLVTSGLSKRKGAVTSAITWRHQRTKLQPTVSLIFPEDLELALQVPANNRFC